MVLSGVGAKEVGAQSFAHFSELDATTDVVSRTGPRRRVAGLVQTYDEESKRICQIRKRSRLDRRAFQVQVALGRTCGQAVSSHMALVSELVV
jgi:hypothetical protein